MGVDYKIIAGDTEPLLADTLTYDNGAPVPLEGCTVTLQLRDLTAGAPIELTGSVSVNVHTSGVQFAPTVADTTNNQPGMYLARWRVVDEDGGSMSFPTDGYITVEIAPSLETPGGQLLVSLPAVLDYLNIPANNRIHDAKLLKFIRGVRPLVEQLTGPIIPQIFDEWYDGGHPWITLRHRPRAGIDTTPFINVIACSEYLGPVEWPLALVASPDQGQLYSVMVDVRLGRVVRRTAGGGTQPFPYQAQAVHIEYEAGQRQVPDNVELAVLETIREAYDTTQATGAGKRTPADEEEGQLSLNQAFAAHGRRLLQPTRKFPGMG